MICVAKVIKMDSRRLLSLTLDFYLISSSSLAYMRAALTLVKCLTAGHTHSGPARNYRLQVAVQVAGYRLQVAAGIVVV